MITWGLLLLTVAYGGGILLAVYGGWSLQWQQGLFLFVCLLAWGVWAYYGRRSSALVLVLLLLVTGMLSGFLRGAAAWHAEDALRSLQEQTVTLTGQVEAASVQQRDQGVSLLLQVEQVRGAPQLKAAARDRKLENTTQSAAKVCGQVRLFLPGAQERFPGQIYTGRLRVTGELRPLAGHFDPGVRDAEWTGRLRGCGGKMSVRPAQVIHLPGRPDLDQRLQRQLLRLRTEVLRYLPPREGPLLLSMVLGGYRDVDETAAEIFRQNGLAHLLAVSGTHIALLTAVLLYLLPEHPARRWIVGGLNFLYAAACGFQPAVARAVTGSLVLLAAASSKRRAHRGRLLLGTALLLLLVKPLWLLEIGFQLSFVTVTGLLLLLPKLRLYLWQGGPAVLQETAAVTLTAQLVSLPLTIWYFQVTTPIALISNLLLVPALAAAALLLLPVLALTFLVLAWGGTPAGFGAAVRFLLLPSALLVRGVLTIGGLLAKLPGAVWACAHWGWIRILAYYSLLLGWLTPGALVRLRPRLRLGLLLISAVIFVGLGAYQLVKPQPLTIHFMDVGQGDAALILTPSKQAFLIDTGGLPGAYDVGAKIVVPYLRYLGVAKLDGLFLSHGDHDHTGGAAAVAQALPVKRLWRTAAAPGSEERQLLEHLPPETAVQSLQAGEAWQLGETLVEVLAAGVPSPGKPAGNSESLVLRFTCAGQKLLFPGDAAEAEEMAAGTDVAAQVLKVGHHGSAGSSSELFLQRVRPELAVISVGERNLFGHPSPEALRRLKDCGALVLRTDLLGAVKVVFDGPSYKWYSYKYQSGEF